MAAIRIIVLRIEADPENRARGYNQNNDFLDIKAEGQHNEFPAYEMLINGQVVYAYSQLQLVRASGILRFKPRNGRIVVDTKMNAVYNISAALCMFFCSCKQSLKKINLEIPENFQGVIHIYKSDQDKPKPIGNLEVKVVVPESGVTFTDHYEAFADWHQITPISKNDTGKEFHLFGLGEVNKTHMIYFYGDVDVYEKQISKISAFDLKPGRFP